MADTKKQSPSKGLQDRMQDVYFEFLPPKKEETAEGKTSQEKRQP
jgi:hypothetical protein